MEFFDLFCEKTTQKSSQRKYANDYYETTRNIGTHIIDLENGIITAESKNEIMDTPYNDFWEM